MDNPFGSSLIFRGGTALRLAYGSPRFSDDLDFSCLVDTTEKEFRAWCQQTAKTVPYLELDEALKKYFTLYAMFKIKDPALAETISIKLEISTRPAVWVKNRDYQLLSLKSQVTPLTVLAQVASLERLEQEKVSIQPPRIRDIFDRWFLSQQLKKNYRMDWTGFDAQEVRRELYRLLATPQRKLLEQWLPKE
jgi:predicted nucleotidyltransferase component of viral defense system